MIETRASPVTARGRTKVPAGKLPVSWPSSPRLAGTLDEETVREARELAAQRGLSVSAFLRVELAGLVERQRGYLKARDSAVKRLRHGQALGGGKLPSREKLHDRALDKR